VRGPLKAAAGREAAGGPPAAGCVVPGLARPVSPSRALRWRCALASPTTLRVAL